MEESWQVLTAVWERCVAHLKSPERRSVEIDLLRDLQNAFRGFESKIKDIRPGTILPSPPSIYNYVAVPADADRSALSIIRVFSQPDAFKSALALLSAAKQCLATDEESLVARVGAMSVLPAVSEALCACHWLQADLFQKELGSMLRAGASASQTSRTAASPTPSRERIELELLLRRLCHPDIFTAGAALIATASAKVRRLDSSSGAATGGPGRGGSVKHSVGMSGSQWVVSDLLVILHPVLESLYYLASCAQKNYLRRGLKPAAPLLRGILESLERSQLLEIACEAMLHMATPSALLEARADASTGPVACSARGGPASQRGATQPEAAEAATRAVCANAAARVVVPGEDGNFMRQTTFITAYLADGMATLAFVAKDIFGPDANSARDPLDALAEAKTPGMPAPERRPPVQDDERNGLCLDLSLRIATQLMRPHVQRFQCALLSRFCLNGTVTPPPPQPPSSPICSSAGPNGGGGVSASTGLAGVSTSAVGQGSTGARLSSGWGLDDDLRLDIELVKLCGGLYGSGLVDADSCHVITLLTLASPALLTWSAAAAHPQLLTALTCGLDAFLARVWEAAVRLLDGLGEQEGGYHQIGNVLLFGRLSDMMGACAPAGRFQVAEERAKLRRGQPSVIGCSPAYSSESLAAAGWEVAAELRFAVAMLLAGGDETAAPDRPSPEASCWAWRQWWDGLSGRHWLPRAWSVFQVLPQTHILRGWPDLDAAAQQEAAQYLLRSDLLPTLDHALRLLVTHSGTVVVAEKALPHVNFITETFLRPLLGAWLQPRAALFNSVAAGASSAGSASSGQAPAPPASPRPSLNLGLFVTVAKLSARLADGLQTATEKATGGAIAGGGPGGSSGSSRGNQEAREKLYLLWDAVCDCFDVLARLSTTAGPVGVASELQDAKMPQDILAVSLVCMQAALAAGLVLLRSLHNQWKAQARTLLQAVRLVQEDVQFRDILHRAFNVVRAVPAMLTASSAGGPYELPPAQLLAARPEELLALCCEVALLAVQTQEGSRDDAMFLSHGLRHTIICATGLAARAEYAPHVHAWLTAASEASDSGVPRPGPSAGVQSSRREEPRLRSALLGLAIQLEATPVWGLITSKQTAQQMQALVQAVESVQGSPEPPLPLPLQKQKEEEEEPQDASASSWLGFHRRARKLLCGISERNRLMQRASAGLQCPGEGPAPGVSGPDRIAASGGQDHLPRWSPGAFVPVTSIMQALRGAGLSIDPEGFTVPEAEAEAEAEAGGERQEGGNHTAPAQPGAGEPGGSQGSLRELLKSVKICGNPGCANFAKAHESLLKLKRCGGCESVRYCSPACQKQHWKEHNAACNWK